jgi:O-antigen ligase
MSLTLRRVLGFVVFCLGTLGIARRFTRREIILFTFFCTGLYLVIGLLAEIGLGTFHPFSSGYRFAGTIHPNLQGANCALLILATVSLIKNEQRWRHFLVPVVIIAFIFLMLAKSRTSIACTIVALYLFWILEFSKSKKFSITFCSVIFLFFLSLYLLLYASFPIVQQFTFMGREKETIYTLTGRIPLWQECLEYAAKRPLLGYGYRGFWTPENINEISSVVGWGVNHSHSAYIDRLLDLGLIGLVVFLCIFLLGLFNSFAYDRTCLQTKHTFHFILLLFCLFHGFLESTIILPNLLSFISMLVLIHVGFIQSEN